jgi:multiple sugar transport system ATP-binding protein
VAEVLLKNISKVYEGSVKAVDNANITVKDKEFVVLVGPSGCGKSTTLRMVAGLEEITSGDLVIDGKRVNDIAPKDRDIAMVFQNYALYPHMTVYENMAFGLRIRKFTKEEIDSRVKEAAQILDIEELLHRKPKALSGGQRQRVAVGRALVRHPKVFLFDEPLSNLDAKLRGQMRAEISALHNRLQATMIYVTHDQVEAMTMGDKIVVMKSGLIQQIGSPMRLYNEPINRFVAGFIGSPPMNIFSARVWEEKGKIVLKEAGLIVTPEDEQAEVLKPYVNREVLLGIRPEDLVYVKKPDARSNLKGNVDIIEPLGSEIQLHVSTRDHQFITKTPPDNEFTIGEEVDFTPNLGKIHLFDPETERSLLYKE